MYQTTLVLNIGTSSLMTVGNRMEYMEQIKYVTVPHAENNMTITNKLSDKSAEAYKEDLGEATMNKMAGKKRSRSP